MSLKALAQKVLSRDSRWDGLRDSAGAPVPLSQPLSHKPRRREARKEGGVPPPIRLLDGRYLWRLPEGPRGGDTSEVGELLSSVRRAGTVLVADGRVLIVCAPRAGLPTADLAELFRHAGTIVDQLHGESDLRLGRA